MDDECSNAIVIWLLRRIAVLINATEAFAFGISADARRHMRFPLLAHIRPENASGETLRAAQDAFVKLARPCLQTGKDGAIELRSPEPEGRVHNPQFCLVCLIRPTGPFAMPAAMIGFIARFPDLAAAKAALQRVKMVSPDESSYE